MVWTSIDAYRIQSVRYVGPATWTCAASVNRNEACHLILWIGGFLSHLTRNKDFFKPDESDELALGTVTLKSYILCSCGFSYTLPPDAEVINATTSASLF